MSVNIPGSSYTSDAILGSATQVAVDTEQDINGLLTSINSGTGGTIGTNGSTIAAKYGDTVSDNLSISDASGAMVIDDLMQKMSTKVQVAAQLLSSANNIAKTASRILSQG
jgi:hypothetical protein